MRGADDRRIELLGSECAGTTRQWNDHDFDGPDDGFRYGEHGFGRRGIWFYLCDRHGRCFAMFRQQFNGRIGAWKYDDAAHAASRDRDLERGRCIMRDSYRSRRAFVRASEQWRGLLFGA